MTFHGILRVAVRCDVRPKETLSTNRISRRLIAVSIRSGHQRQAYGQRGHLRRQSVLNHFSVPLDLADCPRTVVSRLRRGRPHCTWRLRRTEDSTGMVLAVERYLPEPTTTASLSQAQLQQLPRAALPPITCERASACTRALQRLRAPTRL
ncbi:MAG: hypothetical protein RL326_2201 [Pseudomonadota bacterium]